MSGFEIAGVLLGTFPLIISGLEHWRDVAKVGGFFWQVRTEYTKCRHDVQFHELWYKRNLKELLLPIVNDAEEVDRLVSDPGGKNWRQKALQERLQGRLQESYDLYMEIIREMNETAEELRKELSLDKATVQSKLAPPAPKKQQRSSSPQPPSKPSKRAFAKSKWDYETFRLKFSFNEPVRNELFNQLKKCNHRLEKLLSTSDKVSALQNTVPASMGRTLVLETALKRAWKKSDLLFKALDKAWQCSCQQYHFASLRLEHHTLPEICFEVILLFSNPPSQETSPWLWKELQCRQIIGCPFPHKLMKPSTPQSSSRPSDSTSTPVLSPTSERRRKVTFAATAPTVPKIELDIPVDPGIKLCQLLGEKECGKCMGIISHDNEIYHLHPFKKRKLPDGGGPLTLGHILSSNFEGHPTRRQRYSIALLLASSVAQLRFTPWLKTGLTKEDILFFPCENDDCSVPYHEPFIRQGFPPYYHPANPHAETSGHNFYSLGILLLELCFGRRLEDCHFRKRYPVGAGQEKQAFDLLAALSWCRSVSDEGGDDYASAVKWCFVGWNGTNQSWQSEIIKEVIRPLETCQEHFKTAAVS